MCDGVSLFRRELPEELIERHRLRSRIVARTAQADSEIQFLHRDPRPMLPAWHGDRLEIYPWGNRDRRRSPLPRTGLCARESLEAGHWQALRPEVVEIPANLGLDKGIWFHVTQGMQGLLVHDEHQQPHVYLLTEPASHYYRIMTRHDRMPVMTGRGL